MPRGHLHHTCRIGSGPRFVAVSTTSRRHMLGLGAGVLGAALVATSCSPSTPRDDPDDGPGPYGPLGAPNGDGVAVPPGFTARIVARSTQVVPGTSYRWHLAPDGGACFSTPDGGWVYVSNSEVLSFMGGGVGALSFAPDGSVRGAYRILSGTNSNCAGGPTPWGTWLSCEENIFGQVHECNPTRPGQGVVRPAMGRFNHEAAAVDPATGFVYLTEDERDGRFYRFRPSTPGDLSRGVLEAAHLRGSRVSWVGPIDPNVPQRIARRPDTTIFRGGEGCWYDAGTVYFTTKGDNRVWAYHTAGESMRVIYRPEASANPVLRGVDNVTVSPRGDVVVAEDGDDQQLVLVTVEGEVTPFLQLSGQPDSELTGPAFSPDGSRLYVSSQRGVSGERDGSGGLTYEITGPFDS
jgi:secreted PhoX family phosphatase